MGTPPKKIFPLHYFKKVSTPHWRCVTILTYISILMGKHATEAQKIAFCAHLQHVRLAEVARLAGLGSTVALRLKEQIGAR